MGPKEGDGLDSARPNRTQVRVAVTVACLIAWLALQPTFVTRDPFRQSEFAWEMYSKSAPRDEFVVFGPSGSRRVTVRDIQTRGLALVDYTRVLPPHICRVEPDTTHIEVYRGDGLLWTYQCRA